MLINIFLSLSVTYLRLCSKEDFKTVNTSVKNLLQKIIDCDQKYACDRYDYVETMLSSTAL